MRVTLLCCVALLVVPFVDAAPARAPGREAKEKLEALKKRLPDVVRSWTKERWSKGEAVEVRIVRMLGPSQAKVVLLSRGTDPFGRPSPDNDKVFTIFLNFYGGIWSTTRLDGSAQDACENRFLMLAIDEAAEK
jgi:hypothetical protein